MAHGIAGPPSLLLMSRGYASCWCLFYARNRTSHFGSCVCVYIDGQPGAYGSQAWHRSIPPESCQRFAQAIGASAPHGALRPLETQLGDVRQYNMKCKQQRAFRRCQQPGDDIDQCGDELRSGSSARQSLHHGPQDAFIAWVRNQQFQLGADHPTLNRVLFCELLGRRVVCKRREHGCRAAGFAWERSIVLAAVVELGGVYSIRTRFL